MRIRSGKVFILLAMAISCLTVTVFRAQAQPDAQDREHQEMREEEWRRHHERYFGGTAIQPAPQESREVYRARVQNQCKVQWSVCATSCNTVGNPNQRMVCVSTCNNELNECNQF
jgi:hypothetical protein